MPTWLPYVVAAALVAHALGWKSLLTARRAEPKPRPTPDVDLDQLVERLLAAVAASKAEADAREQRDQAKRRVIEAISGGSAPPPKSPEPERS